MNKMNWKLATDNILKELLSKKRLGLISDVDGTLSPIVDKPDDAQVTPRNLELLSKLKNKLALVALISGRAAQDLSQRVGLPGIVYIGNHGLERWDEGKTIYSPDALPYLDAVENAYQEMKTVKSPGLFLENKSISISLHYRQSPSPEKFAHEFHPLLENIATNFGLSLSEGRKVFEFKPPLQIDKGIALRELVTESKLDAAIYLGDDTTDIAALNMVKQLRSEGICDAWGIAVQSEEGPAQLEGAADWLASGVADVEEFLNWLLSAANASST
jgi:trehalose 6-phosphate phosphatase